MPELSMTPLFDDVPNYVSLEGEYITLHWSEKGLGFGQIAFLTGTGSSLFIENEGMSRAFIKEKLCQMVDEAVLEDEPAPNKDSEEWRVT